MATLDARNPLRPNNGVPVDFLGSLSFAAYAVTAGDQDGGQLLIENFLPEEPEPPREPNPVPASPNPGPAPHSQPPAHQHINDRTYDARTTDYQFWFRPLQVPEAQAGTLTIRLRNELALLYAGLEQPVFSYDLWILLGDQGSLVLRDFLSPIHKGSPITHVRVEIEDSAGVRALTQSTVEFFTERLAQTSFTYLVAWFADSLTSGAGSLDLMRALQARVIQEFHAGAIHSDLIEVDHLDFLEETPYRMLQTPFYFDFIKRLTTDTFTLDDVLFYATLRWLRSDRPDNIDLDGYFLGMSAPSYDMPLILDENLNSPDSEFLDPGALNRLTKAAYFAGYKALVEATPTFDTVALESLHARRPNAMPSASPLVDVTLKALRVDQDTQNDVRELFAQGTAVINGVNVSLHFVHPSELPSGVNGALVSDARGGKLLLVSQMLTAPWRNVVVAEELASVLAQRYETRTQSELPGDEGRYVLARLVRDIVHEVRHQGPRASEWQAAFDALPSSWTTLSDTELNQLVARASLSNDKYVVKADGKEYTYELSSFGDWTAPVAGAIAGVITGATLGTVGLFAAGPAGAALGAKAGLETGLLVAGLSALGGGAIGGVAGAAYASAQETQSLQQDIGHRLNPASPSIANDTLEQTFRQAAYVAPTDVSDVLALLRAGLSYGEIMAMPGVDKVALATESFLLPKYGYDNPYFSNLDNVFGFESLGSVVSATQRQLIEKRIQANIAFEDQTDVAHELFAYGNARGMLGHLLKHADAQGIDLALSLYQNIRFAYTHTATQDIFKAVDPLTWGGELGFWAVNEKTKSSPEDISAEFVTNGDYKNAQGSLADLAFAQLTSLLEKPGMLQLLSPNKMVELLRYLTQTTMMSQAADLEMLRLAHALETQPSGELVAEVVSFLLGSAAAGIKTIEERGFRILAAQTQALADQGDVSPEWSFLSDQVKQVVQGFNKDVLQPLSEEGKVIGPVHEAGLGEFGPVALMQGAKWEDMLFPQAPLARGWLIDPRLALYINTREPFLKDSSGEGVFSALHWQHLLRDGTATDSSGQFIVSLRLVDPQTMGGLHGQVAARAGADGRHHIEVLISRDLSPADRDGVLFEELNNVDEYIHSSRHETDPINYPLIDPITVGDFGGRALLSYEMYLRTHYNKGLPMFANLSDPSLGYALKVETINDDRYVDSVVLHDGVPETVTLYANTMSAVTHPNASNYFAVRPAIYLSTHTGYAIPDTVPVPLVSRFFKQYVDLSRVRIQWSLDPVAKLNQGGEPPPGKGRPVSDSWTSFDITLENLSSLMLHPGTQLPPNAAVLAPMLWDLSTWSVDLSNGTPFHQGSFRKSPSFSYQTGLAGGFTDRPGVAEVNRRAESEQDKIDVMKARIDRAHDDEEKMPLREKLDTAELELGALNAYKEQLSNLEDDHAGQLSRSLGSRFGAYLFGLRDFTRPVDTGIDQLDYHAAIATEALGGLGAIVSGIARGTGLGYHDASGKAAIFAFFSRAATQATASGLSQRWFNEDLGLFDDNGIHRPEVLEKYGLGNGPDGQPNAQIEKYLSLVEAGQSAGLTPMARSWLAGISLQGFWGMQLKKDIAVTRADNRLEEQNLPEQSDERFRRENEAREAMEINFRPEIDPNAPPPPAPVRDFVYAPHHIEGNVGFFISAGARFDVTTAVTRDVNSSLEVPVWQQGVLGV